MERILAIHDAVMPEMGTISGLIGQLEPAFVADSTLVNYAAAVEDLKMANGAIGRVTEQSATPLRSKRWGRNRYDADFGQYFFA